MSGATPTPFHAWMRERVAEGPLGPDALLRALLPLFEQVLQLHATGKVAPLAGLQALSVIDDRAFFSVADALEPRRAAARVAEVDREESRGLTIHGTYRVDETGEAPTAEDLRIGTPGSPIDRPVFLPAYVSWEHELGHHDELTDVFSLGMLLASLACGLDLADDESLKRFVTGRENLFRLNPRLHPVIAKLIVRMTEPSRRARAQDLPELFQGLLSYREQGQGALDLHAIPGFETAEHRERRALIQARLRDRLFEISRRNRLLHFREALGVVNLTVSSVPLQLDVGSLSPDALCTWRGEVAEALSHRKPLALGKYLRFEDAPYLPGVLDRIRAEDKRNRAEYGFSQLRLVLAFLRWNNLKENKEERIDSPLLLLPVELSKKKGVRDSFVITPTTERAEVNPVLRHHLRQLYGLELPEAVDLGEASVDALFEVLQQQIAHSEPGVTLRKVERPVIDLVHRKAQLRVEQYRRSARLTGRGIRRAGDVDYSYGRENFQPLGLQLFLRKVRPALAADRELAGESPRPRTLAMAARPEPAAPVVERKQFALRQGSGDSNPYVWDFDLCSLTLGSFNSQKMSLVRDYHQLLQEPAAHPAFDRIFPVAARAIEESETPPLSRDDAFTVVPADPTQLAAIARARTGASYIIQGPPGTGKSQTITNLIADYVARGKRVLFVCAKRAALDVVFHRLKQRQLDPLCALIHDSQDDKKPFIQELKATYEKSLEQADAFEDADRERTAVRERIATGLEALRRFSEAMARAEVDDGMSVHQLLTRLVTLRAHRPQLTPAEQEQLPTVRHWMDVREQVLASCRALADLGHEPVLAAHPFRRLSAQVLQAPRPLETCRTGIERALGAMGTVSSALQRVGVTFESTVAETETAFAFARDAAPVVELGNAALLDRDHPRVRELELALVELRQARRALEEARKVTAHWKQKLPKTELPDALALARKAEGGVAIFKPSWWAIRKVLAPRYDFAAHAVRPSRVAVLEQLQAEYAAEDALAALTNRLAAGFGTQEVESLAERVEALHRAEPTLTPAARAVRESVLAGADARTRLRTLTDAEPAWAALRDSLAELLAPDEGLTVAQAGKELEQIRERLAELPHLLHPLAQLAARATPEVRRALSAYRWSPDQFEAAILEGALERAYRSDPSLVRFDGALLDQHVHRLDQALSDAQEVNARWILARTHAEFRRKVQRSSSTAEAGTREERDWKRRYARGRRELEHEFSKVMRYRAIRELAGGDTGEVIADLKPVWLMSPLSVSDTLPLSGSFFDVVIYDEASQIPLEDAVPALYRGPQAIVVGDERQLPPTRFFSAGDSPDAEEQEGAADVPALDSDSFLNQAARNLPSTLLAWHYRSRSESLISFSNAAFYERKLLTIPDPQVWSRKAPIEVESAQEGADNAARVLDRAIGFHFVRKALYSERRNAAEAVYLAQLVRGLLTARTGLSLGLVAFSQAQQAEIERALEALAAEDPAFAELLEAEQVREQDEQFAGLFVKNLENVQGDERDIILLSVCYGPDARGKVAMNFGPINQSGGERRLNVVFSRAKRHMVVVSSIRSGAITNDYNDGANALKRYLAYAEAASSGEEERARRVLAECCPPPKRVERTGASEAAVSTLARALEAHGLEVALDVGESVLRCPVAVRPKGAERYALAVLVDDEAHYAVGDLAERYVLRPRLMQGLGWSTALALTKDLWHQPDAAVQRLRKTLERT